MLQSMNNYKGKGCVSVCESFRDGVRRIPFTLSQTSQTLNASFLLLL